MRPSSKQAMANEIVMPAEIVSTPYMLHSSFALAMTSKSSTPQLEPNAARVSYSGPP